MWKIGIIITKSGGLIAQWGKLGCKSGTIQSRVVAMNRDGKGGKGGNGGDDYGVIWNRGIRIKKSPLVIAGRGG